MRHAQTVDGIVVNIVEAEPDIKIDGLTLVPDEAGSAHIGGTWDGASFGPVPDLRTLDEARTDKLAALAERRWLVETGGITVAGRRITTDDRSKTLIHGARTAADKDAAFSTRFKIGGQSVLLTAPEIIAISDAVLAHVAACFDREGDLIDAIHAAADRAALDAIDITVGWPGEV